MEEGKEGERCVGGVMSDGNFLSREGKRGSLRKGKIFFPPCTHTCMHENMRERGEDGKIFFDPLPLRCAHALE